MIDQCEEMKDIPGFEGLYAATEDGQIWTHRAKRFRKLQKCGNGYLFVKFEMFGKCHLVHRLIASTFLGLTDASEVDHVNSVKSDNRVSNLRVCNHSQNNANCCIRANNKTGFKGVTKRSDMVRWKAQIGFGGVMQTIGLFTSAEDAAKAYDSAARAIYGEFAKTNFP